MVEKSTTVPGGEGGSNFVPWRGDEGGFSKITIDKTTGGIVVLVGRRSIHDSSWEVSPEMKGLSKT
jgi:hypothetical protein